uniref:E3 class 1 protein n=1 Tax=Murine adenovirus A serotype 1 TaxID=10530 RepID=Q64884_ADEM1|nr:E3 class 1 protein [Murine adenovirus 1]
MSEMSGAPRIPRSGDRLRFLCLLLLVLGWCLPVTGHPLKGVQPSQCQCPASPPWTNSSVTSFAQKTKWENSRQYCPVPSESSTRGKNAVRTGAGPDDECF